MWVLLRHGRACPLPVEARGPRRLCRDVVRTPNLPSPFLSLPSKLVPNSYSLGLIGERGRGCKDRVVGRGGLPVVVRVRGVGETNPTPFARPPASTNSYQSGSVFTLLDHRTTGRDSDQCFPCSGSLLSNQRVGLTTRDFLGLV